MCIRDSSILYNVALARRRGADELVDEHRGRMTEWAEQLDMDAMAAWSTDALWGSVLGTGHDITIRARQFVERWISEVLAGPDTLIERPSALRLVEDRERQLKGPRSRFVNQRALDQWSGRSGMRPMRYRWATVHSYLVDLHAALTEPA